MKKYILTENQIKRIVDDLVLEKRVLREAQKSLNSVMVNKKHSKSK